MDAFEAFRWSMSLLAATLTRVIEQGSTVVMKAINANSAAMLTEAISAAPRAERASELLCVQVGTASISPLLWAIEGGRWHVADGILMDLLTIRGDRERYYYGMEELFRRHPNIVQILCDEAPSLLGTLFDGLVWRSRQTTSDGKRRVNYYLKYLLVDEEGKAAGALKWLVSSQEPKNISHNVIVVLTDIVWTNRTRSHFVQGKIPVILSLLGFMLFQAILPRLPSRDFDAIRFTIFVGRMVNYVLTLGRLCLHHAQKCRESLRVGHSIRYYGIPLPGYLQDFLEVVNLALLLFMIATLSHEPIFWCIGSGEAFPALYCGTTGDSFMRYSVFNSLTMVILWVSLVDLAVLSTGLSTFVLVVGMVLSEIGRFLVALVFLLVAFGTAVTMLHHQYGEMQDIPSALVVLFAMTLNLYEDDYRDMLDEPALLFAVFVFVTLSAVLLLNLLIAQLNCSYNFIYLDSVGFARMKRAGAVADGMAVLSDASWEKFMSQLKLSEPLEFNEGDVGVPGGIQILEPANRNKVKEDRILRFGGACSPQMKWPEDNIDGIKQVDSQKRFRRLEKLCQKALKRMVKVAKRKGDESFSHSSGIMKPLSVEVPLGDTLASSLPRESSKPNQLGASVCHRSDTFGGMGMSGMGTSQIGDAISYESVGINITSLDELCLDTKSVQEIRSSWAMFIKQSGSRHAAGEAIFASLFESAPSLRSFFLSPMPVQGDRFAESIEALLGVLDNSALLKAKAEVLGFAHMQFDITSSRVMLFRDATLDLLEVELQDEFTDCARVAWAGFLNYVGGGLIYIKSKFVDRVRFLSESWEMVNRAAASAVDGEHRASLGSGDGQAAAKSSKSNPSISHDQEDNADSGKPVVNQTVPKTYEDMFNFNCAILGFETDSWMAEVLPRFDTLATNISNMPRLQQECDLLVLFINKRTNASEVNLSDYKSCMLASLRSLLSKCWNSDYELAWAWLWENVERLLAKVLPRSPKWEIALEKIMNSFDSEKRHEIRETIWTRLFEAAPGIQDYFKQSNTRLHFIAEKILQMSVEVYKDPWHVTDELFAVGLRHVGYGAPTEFFGSFVTANVEVIASFAEDPVAHEAFRFSLSVMSGLMVRTINEGSTVVMNAVNKNSASDLEEAVSRVPRNARASQLLKIQVGTANISPLYRAIEGGCLEAAFAILTDLLKIRADRERYYYGMEELFRRHPDLMKRLSEDAPSLLPHLLEGLVWRSRNTEDGMRRVNYYLKYLVVSLDGGVSPVLQWIVNSKDQKIVSHPVLVSVAETLWSKYALREFMSTKLGSLFGLSIFLLSQSILTKIEVEDRSVLNVFILVGRVSTYTFTMVRSTYFHATESLRACRRGDTERVCCFAVPQHLMDWYGASSLLLTVLLFLMFVTEPMIWCAGSNNWPTEKCGFDRVNIWYSYFTFIAMVIHWTLLADLACLSTDLSAFVLVVGEVMTEIGRFLVALLFLLCTFASASCVLEHGYEDMKDFHHAILVLVGITLGVFEHDYRNLRRDWVLLTAVFIFVTCTVILLLNLLIAQINCSYEHIYQDSVGYALLKRAEVIADLLQEVDEAKWTTFVDGLGLDTPLEFNSGDVGMPGGITIWEKANLHIVLEDRIVRYGGSCDPEAPWPHGRGYGNDKLRRLEESIESEMRTINMALTNKLMSADSGSMM
eukprot:TRINITY_DN12832_c0_g1_i1.p1 TRINITY_DN12832_c0_g1~~TRINITY_DN12832_c0_g1_i1.p1  ORF type:complete len:1689 (-),score=245.76 TRINITY_DN12832_c0_g1_i1:41-5026(-)